MCLLGTAEGFGVCASLMAVGAESTAAGASATALCGQPAAGDGQLTAVGPKLTVTFGSRGPGPEGAGGYLRLLLRGTSNPSTKIVPTD